MPTIFTTTFKRRETGTRIASYEYVSMLQYGKMCALC